MPRPCVTESESLVTLFVPPTIAPIDSFASQDNLPPQCYPFPPYISSLNVWTCGKKFFNPFQFPQWQYIQIPDVDPLTLNVNTIFHFGNQKSLIDYSRPAQTSSVDVISWRLAFDSMIRPKRRRTQSFFPFCQPILSLRNLLGWRHC